MNYIEAELFNQDNPEFLTTHIVTCFKQPNCTFRYTEDIKKKKDAAFALELHRQA